MTKKNLLILPCSKLKKHVDNVTGLDLYDGPFYRVVRKNNIKNIDILIISAKYGLIRSNELISYYDQKMTVETAKEIGKEIKNKLEPIIVNNNYCEIFVNLGKTYMLALEDSRSLLEGDTTLWASGRIGERLHQLKNWFQRISIADADQ